RQSWGESCPNRNQYLRDRERSFSYPSPPDRPDRDWDQDQQQQDDSQAGVKRSITGQVHEPKAPEQQSVGTAHESESEHTPSESLHGKPPPDCSGEFDNSWPCRWRYYTAEGEKRRAEWAL